MEMQIKLFMFSINRQYSLVLIWCDLVFHITHEHALLIIFFTVFNIIECMVLWVQSGPEIGQSEKKISGRAYSAPPCPKLASHPYPQSRVVGGRGVPYFDW